MDWSTLGAGLAAATTGALGWIAGRSKRKLDDSETSLGTIANNATARAILRLEAEVEHMRKDLDEVRERERRMTQYVGILIDVMMAHKIDVPPMPMPQGSTA